MDLGTGLAALGGAALGKDLIIKLLGPTADYIGSELKNFTEKRNENIKNIIQNAINKTDLQKAGGVPPKVLRGILNEGSFCDDFISTEYFGGVLAASRSEISRDDRGAYFIALISRLSSYQLRTHYAFYHMVKKRYNGSSLKPNMGNHLKKMGIYLPFEVFVNAMDFSEKEDYNSILQHIMTGLTKEELIEDTYAYGDETILLSFNLKVEKPGIIFKPSKLGIELFHWVNGRSDLLINDFLDPNNEFNIVPDIILLDEYKSTEDVISSQRTYPSKW